MFLVACKELDHFYLINWYYISPEIDLLYLINDILLAIFRNVNTFYHQLATVSLLINQTRNFILPYLSPYFSNRPLREVHISIPLLTKILTARSLHFSATNKKKRIDKKQWLLYFTLIIRFIQEVKKEGNTGIKSLSVYYNTSPLHFYFLLPDDAHTKAFFTEPFNPSPHIILLNSPSPIHPSIVRHFNYH